MTDFEHATDADRDEPADEDDAWTLGSDLRELFHVHADLAATATDRVDSRLRSRSALGTAVELVGVGWETMKVILIDDPVDADGYREGL